MPNDDLISREALLEAPSEKPMVDVFPNWKDFDSDLRHILCKLGDAFEHEIEAVPAVDAEPVRHGRYEFIGMDMLAGTRSFRFGTCSECKQRINFAYKHNKYCPNCGAKMDLKEDG